MIAITLFVVLLTAGVFGIRRLRKYLLGDLPSAADENPAWLEAAIAEHRRASAAATRTELSA